MVPVNRHRLWQLFADAALIAAAWFLAFQLRFDVGVPPPYERLFEKTILLVVPLKIAVFILPGSTRTGGGTRPSATCGARRAG